MMTNASVSRRTARPVVFAGFAAVAMFGWMASATAQLIGGIIQAPLNVTVAVYGLYETFGGCYDGDHGQWTVSPLPGYGVTSTAVVVSAPQTGCPNNPPYADVLYYKLTQPIPCGQHDSFSATWQSSHVTRSGSWTPAYIPLATTHNFFGPCDGSLPFASGIMFAGTFQSPANGPGGNSSYALWQMSKNGLAGAQGIGQVATNWTLIGQRDFNGDGYADLLWRDADSGTVAIWFMNGFQMTSSVALGAVPSSWSVYGTGNLDGTIAALGSLPGDILWRDSNTGAVSVWYMGGTSTAATADLGVVPLNFTIIGDDNNGNIYWRDNNYNYSMWHLTGIPPATVVTSGGLGNIPGNWAIQGFGDFYGDGNMDILWRDTNTGAIAIWNMNGFQVQATSSLGAVPNSWNIVQTGDYNGDGTSDLLWLDGSGNLAIWYLNAGQVSATAGLGNIGPSWAVQSANSE